LDIGIFPFDTCASFLRAKALPPLPCDAAPAYPHRSLRLVKDPSETEKLREVRELVGRLTNDTVFMNEHASNLFHVQCRIPHAKDKLLAYIDDFIERSNEGELRGYREAVTRAFQ
jgi:hypothetical protein